MDNNAASTAATGTPEEGSADRILSIDIFRGLTIVSMIFANTSTKMGLPWWMEHANHTEGKGQLITWPDLIFPAFLFVMGIAIPLALEKRLAKGESWQQVVGHVVVRGLLLMWLGGVLYGFGINGEAMGISIAVWVTTGFVALGALLIDWPTKSSDSGAKPIWIWVLRAAAVVYFLWATTAFRGAEESAFFKASGFTFSILGLLGFGYITASIIWLATRKAMLARLAVYGLIILFGMHLQQDESFLKQWFPTVIGYLGLPGSFADRGSIVLAGTFLGDVLLGRRAPSPWMRRPRAFLAVFGLGLLVASALADGDFFKTIVGLRKTLFCTGLCTLGFLAIWKIELVSGTKRVFKAITRPLIQVGHNPLFTYSLQFCLGGILALIVGNKAWVDAIEGYILFGAKGWLGVLYTVLPYTIVVVLLTSLANRFRLFMKL
jgi:heparan-alpha-glucosaminide N-acetyltransferase